MKTVERIVIVLIILVLLGGGAWVYFSIKNQQQKIRDDVARGAYQIPVTTGDGGTNTTQSDTPVTQDNWRVYYPTVVPMLIGSTTVMASVADSLPERIKGLSDTPYLPDSVVKLFAFGVNGEHSIWMKDMNYALDVMWVSEEGKIVHIEPNISPDTYPQSFGSPAPAFYVIEANAGFVASSSIVVGDTVVVSLGE